MILCVFSDWFLLLVDQGEGKNIGAVGQIIFNFLFTCTRYCYGREAII